MIAAAEVINTMPATLADESVYARAVGITVVAVFPAIIWALLLSFAAPIAGLTLSTSALGFVAAAIACFLASVCAPMMLRH